MNNDTGKSSINLKMSDELKEKIKLRANFRKQTLSRYIRELLADYFDGSLCKGTVTRNENKEFINSTEFLQLVVWVYSKRKSNKHKETPQDLDRYSATLKKTANHLPKYVVAEFDKVLLDIIRVQNESKKFTVSYKFVDVDSSSLMFNYDVLEKYLLNYEKVIKVPSLGSFEGLKTPIIKKQ